LVDQLGAGPDHLHHPIKKLGEFEWKLVAGRIAIPGPQLLSEMSLNAVVQGSGGRRPSGVYVRGPFMSNSARPG
jgi:hypothetical protein